MRPATFNELLERRIARTREVLAAKSAEYASVDDKLHNFKHAAALLRETPAESCLGMAAKHIVSVVDMVEKHAAGVCFERAVIDEKFGDAVNYLILLEAILLEQQLSVPGQEAK